MQELKEPIFFYLKRFIMLSKLFNSIDYTEKKPVQWL